MITTASPAACSRPALEATCWPKLRDRARTRTPRIPAAQPAQEVQRGVAAAVIHIDELEVESGNRREDGHQAAVGLLDARLLVVAGDDHRQQRRRGRTGHRSAEDSAGRRPSARDSGCRTPLPPESAGLAVRGQSRASTETGEAPG